MNNCLSCRFCELSPQTDFNKPAPVIHCTRSPCPNHVGGLREIELEECPRYNRDKRGGKKKRWSAVAIAFLRAHYPAGMSVAMLSLLLGRTSDAVIDRAFKLMRAEGIKRDEPRRKFDADNPRVNTWTRAQDAFLLRAIASGPWPYRTMTRAEQQAARAEIVERLAELGPPRIWNTVKAHAYVLSPAKQRKGVKMCRG